MATSTMCRYESIWCRNVKTADGANHDMQHPEMLNFAIVCDNHLCKLIKGRVVVSAFSTAKFVTICMTSQIHSRAEVIG